MEKILHSFKKIATRRNINDREQNYYYIPSDQTLVTCPSILCLDENIYADMLLITWMTADNVKWAAQLKNDCNEGERKKNY